MSAHSFYFLQSWHSTRQDANIDDLNENGFRYVDEHNAFFHSETKYWYVIEHKLFWSSEEHRWYSYDEAKDVWQYTRVPTQMAPGPWNATNPFKWGFINGKWYEGLIKHTRMSDGARLFYPDVKQRPLVKQVWLLESSIKSDRPQKHVATMAVREPESRSPNPQSKQKTSSTREVEIPKLKAAHAVNRGCDIQGIKRKNENIGDPPPETSDNSNEEILEKIVEQESSKEEEDVAMVLDSDSEDDPEFAMQNFVQPRVHPQQSALAGCGLSGYEIHMLICQGAFNPNPAPPVNKADEFNEDDRKVESDEELEDQVVPKEMQLGEAADAFSESEDEDEMSISKRLKNHKRVLEIDLTSPSGREKRSIKSIDVSGRKHARALRRLGTGRAPEYPNKTYPKPAKSENPETGLYFCPHCNFESHYHADACNHSDNCRNCGERYCLRIDCKNRSFKDKRRMKKGYHKKCGMWRDGPVIFPLSCGRLQS